MPQKDQKIKSKPKDENKKKPERKKAKQVICRHCAKSIEKTATVCHHCGLHQNILISYIDRLGVLLSVLLVLLAYLQFYEARNERVKAETAHREAQNARVTAEEAAKRASDFAKEIENLNESFRKLALNSASMAYLQAEANTLSVISATNKQDIERRKRAKEELFEDINALIQEAILDPEERNKFNQKLMQRPQPEKK